MKIDPAAIVAGLLHDSVEDTLVTVVDIRKEFGEQVAHIVEGVTKISAIDFATREEQQAENLRKMMLAMVDDIRVVLIKLADRLHNMRTLEHLQPDRRQKIAQETLDIYAPIAHRLGMGKIRGELEDLGFRYVDPIGYQQVHEAVEAPRIRRGLSRQSRSGGSRQAERSWDYSAGGEPNQTAVQHPEKIIAPAYCCGTSLRPVCDARDHAIRARLLRGAGNHSQLMAAGAGAD